MIEQLWNLIQQNQFMSGGLVTVIFSALLFQSRVWGYSLLLFIKRKVCSTIYTENSFGEDFEKIDYWITQNFKDKANSYLLHNPPKIGQCSIYQWKNYCLINIIKSALEKDNIQYAVYRYHLSIYGLRSKRNEIIDTISKINIPNDKGSPVRYNYWELSPVSFIQEPITKQAKNIYKDYQSFLSSKEKYNSLGLKYHRNYLLSGKPGTGKSSLIKYIARKENKSIQSIGISTETTDINILEWFSNKEKYIFVIEDFDRIDWDNPENNWTKATLMNVLDGLYTIEGSVVFATVNDISKLDSALLRSGRFDIIAEFTNPNDEEWADYISENKLPIKLSDISGKTIAEVQKLLKEKL